MQTLEFMRNRIEYNKLSVKNIWNYCKMYIFWLFQTDQPN